MALVHQNPLWGTTKAANYVGVTYWTMAGWLKHGKLPTITAPGSRKRLVRRSALDAYKLGMEGQPTIARTALVDKITRQ